MTAEVISGTRMAEEVRAEVAAGVAEMRSKHGIAPGLAVVLVGDDPASGIYVRRKQQAATEVGMESEVVRLPADTTERDVLSNVRRLNGDARIHGILVQLPLPDQIDENTVIESIDPNKDVDGPPPAEHGQVDGRTTQRFVPATPAAIQEILWCAPNATPRDGGSSSWGGRTSSASPSRTC